jgi:hypothetical protein
MNDFQYCGIQKRYDPCVTNKFLQVALSGVFVLAVVVVPAVAAIKFFLS